MVRSVKRELCESRDLFGLNIKAICNQIKRQV